MQHSGIYKLGFNFGGCPIYEIFYGSWFDGVISLLHVDVCACVCVRERESEREGRREKERALYVGVSILRLR